MKRPLHSLPGWLLIFLWAAVWLPAGNSARAGEAENPRQSVERFYKFVFAHDQNPREKELPKIKEDLEPGLYKSLIKVMNLPEANLDFAPFIAAQDLVGPYRVGTAEVRDGVALVPVSFGSAAAPALKIQLQLKEGRWLISDVFYPAREGVPAYRLSGLISELLKP